MSIWKKLEKAKELAGDAMDSVQEAAGSAVDSAKEMGEDMLKKNESAFLVERFENEDVLAVRLNSLLAVMKEVNVRGMCSDGGELVVIIRVVE